MLDEIKKQTQPAAPVVTAAGTTTARGQNHPHSGNDPQATARHCQTTQTGGLRGEAFPQTLRIYRLSEVTPKPSQQALP